jgi:hypothetical protein
MPLEYDELQSILRWGSVAIVAVGKRASLSRSTITSPLVPGNECLAKMDDGHFNCLGSALSSILFCGLKEPASEASILQPRTYRE